MPRTGTLAQMAHLGRNSAQSSTQTLMPQPWFVHVEKILILELLKHYSKTDVVPALSNVEYDIRDKVNIIPNVENMCPPGFEQGCFAPSNLLSEVCKDFPGGKIF